MARALLWFYYAAVMLCGVSLIMLPRVHGAASMDDAMAEILEKHGGVGLTAWSVNGDGKLCSIGAAGERIKGSGEAFVTTGDSRHNIGSLNKSMTAVLLATLIEEGKIPGGWDSTLGSLLLIAQGSAYENVTLRELLGMLSGLPRTPPGDDWSLYELVSPNDIRTQRFVASLDALSTAPEYAPGTEAHYSNWGYVLAGHIFEEVADQTWEVGIKTRIFKPLGIQLGGLESFFGAPDNDDDPWGHDGDDHMPCDPSLPHCTPLPMVVNPAGGFTGPVAAMAAYFAWHVKCHNGDPNPLLSHETCQELHQPVNVSLSPVALGLTCKNRPWAEDDSFMCSWTGSDGLSYYYPMLAFGSDRAVVAFTNGRRGNFEQDFEMVTEAIVYATTNVELDCKQRMPSRAYIKGPKLSVPKCVKRIKKKCKCGLRFKGTECIKKLAKRKCNPPKLKRKQNNYLKKVEKKYMQSCEKKN